MVLRDGSVMKTGQAYHYSKWKKIEPAMKEVTPKPPLVIYGTDIDKHPADLIEEIRVKLFNLRGNLRDLRSAYPIWTDRVTHIEGGMTCLLVALYDSMEEMQKHREKWGHKRPWLETEDKKDAINA